MRCAFSDSTSAMVSAAITVSLVSPISPNFVRSPSIRVSRSRASSMRWPSWPSSQAMRNCRPLMVTLTWDIAPPPNATLFNPPPAASLSHRAPTRREWSRWPDRCAAPPRDWRFRAHGCAPPHDRGLRRGVSGRCRAHGPDWPAPRRRGRPRAGAPPPRPTPRAPASDAGWQPRSNRCRSWPHPALAQGAKIVRRQPFTKGSLRRVEVERQRLTRFARSCLCMTQPAPERAIDSIGCHVICAQPFRSPRRFAPVPRLASFMTMPERSLAASTAEPSRITSSSLSPSARADHDRMANAIRALAMDAVEKAHPGLPMGAADIATVLFTRFLKFDPADPAWPDRDRFVLSAGHGSMLLYALLYLLGYEAMTIDDIKRFRQIGSQTPGHPEHGHTPGIETTTGPLGQGLANAVGMAIAERHLAAVFGSAIVDHTTYVLASDGDLME